MGSHFTRREFLQVSFGASVSLASAGMVCASDTTPQTYPLILVFLSGGPSAKETFNPDPPSVSEDLRGSLGRIQTSIRGIYFSECFPLLASRAHKFSLIRSLDAGTSDHIPATRDLALVENRCIGEVVGDRSADGSIPYALLNPGRNWPSLQEAFHQSNSFCPLYDAETQRFLPPQMPVIENLQERRDLLEALDTPVNSPQSARIDRFRNTAFDLMQGGGEFFTAFNLPRRERDQYGNNLTGDMILLARRLIQKGAGSVTIYHELDGASWDNHSNICQRTVLQAPPLDRALSILIDEIIEERLRCVLVVMGEFSRTPRINSTGGRDHWSYGNCCIGVGGNFRQGMVFGRVNQFGSILDGSIGQRNGLANTVMVACGMEIPPQMVRAREVLR